MRHRISTTLLSLVLSLSATAHAQDQKPHAGHDASSMGGASGWMVTYDGVLFAIFNHQGGPRGGDELKASNWFMGMASRKTGPGLLTFSGMLSLDPATVTPRGYRELFQVGEAYKGEPVVDRQHPHDLLIQAAVAWRVPLGERTGLTLAGAPVGEPALGPIAFMHRPAAAENPTAPLAHHTLDSTHIAMGVITAAVDRGPWVFESSLFRGREPDDNRWDLMDPGALDSWSARVWFKPSKEWDLQASHGFLKAPEELDPGDLRRTTGSASWWRQRGDGFTAATFAYGRNNKSQGASNALLAEATDRRRALSVYGRLETLQVESSILRSGLAGGDEHARDVVTAFTIGSVRELARWRGFEVGGGGDVTLYGVPDALRPTHGDRPVSFHIFLRIRPPASSRGRMWNMRMAQTLHH